MMTKENLEEEHYYWVLSELLDMIEMYGYPKVMQDIDEGLIQRAVQE